MKQAIMTIQQEHRSISSVLHALKHLTRMAQDASVKPDFRAFRAMLRYIDEYPEKLHHPRESKYLFERLGTRWAEARPLIARLAAEHREGERLIRELERALMIFEEGWPRGRDAFADLVDHYARFHWEHMRVEEQELLPLAVKHFMPQDWAYMGEGFAPNFDPIADLKERDFQALFTRLVNLAPAPIGLGDPWKRVGEPAVKEMP